MNQRIYTNKVIQINDTLSKSTLDAAKYTHKMVQIKNTDQKKAYTYKLKPLFLVKNKKLILKFCMVSDLPSIQLTHVTHVIQCTNKPVANQYY